jgi:hypothetical protein
MHGRREPARRDLLPAARQQDRLPSISLTSRSRPRRSLVMACTGELHNMSRLVHPLEPLSLTWITCHSFARVGWSRPGGWRQLRPHPGWLLDHHDPPPEPPMSWPSRCRRSPVEPTDQAVSPAEPFSCGSSPTYLVGTSGAWNCVDQVANVDHHQFITAAARVR